MRNNALCDSGAGVKGRSGRAEAEMEGSMKLPTGQARTGDDVRSERIMAGFRMSAAGPCRDAGLPEAAKTDEPVAHGCAAVASALGVRIGRQLRRVGLSNRVESLRRPGAEPGDDQQDGCQAWCLRGWRPDCTGDGGRSGKGTIDGQLVVGLSTGFRR